MRGAAGRRRPASKTNGHLIDVVLGTHRVKELPALVERAAPATARPAPAAVDVGAGSTT